MLRKHWPLLSQLRLTTTQEAGVHGVTPFPRAGIEAQGRSHSSNTPNQEVEELVLELRPEWLQPGTLTPAPNHQALPKATKPRLRGPGPASTPSLLTSHLR